MTLGNGLLEQTTFNNRMQPTLIQLGLSTSNPQSVLGLTYTYNTTGNKDNNGNVLSQAINAGGIQIGSQSYTYDGVNRLKAATEGSAWNQTYDYDQFGNRAVRSSSQYIPNPTLTPQSANATDFSAFDQTKNQIKSTLGFQCDSAGNLTGDPNTGPNNIVYDAVNRQTSYTRSSTTGYGYDGDGHRVTKTASGATTVFVYNITGQLIAEYGGSPTNGGVSYLTTDHLDSTRVVTDKNQAIAARHDYLPFGEEIPAGIGNRTVGAGYVSTDDTTQRFTSKERDSESGLDYFGARYYSSSPGRFTSVDAIGSTFSRLIDPQRLNRYGYDRNNPLKYVDPDGNDIKLKSGMKKSDVDKILGHLVRMYRKESGRSALERMEKSDMTFVVGTGKLETKVDLFNQTMSNTYGLTKPEGFKGTKDPTTGEITPDRKSGQVTITFDYDKRSDAEKAHDAGLGPAPPSEQRLTQHEIGHAGEFERDLLKEANRTEQESEKVADAFADKVDREKDAMSKEEAEKRVREILELPPKEEKKKHD